MNTLKSNGEYTFKEDGSKHGFDYSFPVYANIEEAIDEIGETKILSMVNQTSKEDSANNSREATKRANGHSVERSLTPEEKENRKQSRKEDRNLLKMLKANPDLLAQVQG